MSMETGMAWIRWQGSTWAVREGQTLGNVVIQRIDPTTRPSSPVQGRYADEHGCPDRH